MIRPAMLAVCFVIASCSMFKIEPKESNPDIDISDLRAKFVDVMAFAKKIRDQDTGWIAMDCDGFIWSAKAAAAGLHTDLSLAEYESGKFGRRPPNPLWCFEAGEDHGSKTTWSGDMFKAGMLPYAWITRDRLMLERHAEYGQKNDWLMGDGIPSAIDRVVYKPNQIGWLYKAIYKLGGEDNSARFVPDLYVKGLTDYQAHLQMIGIWLYGEMYGEILPVMAERIKEHAASKPGAAFYDYLFANYVTGDFRSVHDMLMATDSALGTYVRCGDQRGCRTAEWLFVAKLLVKRLSK